MFGKRICNLKNKLNMLVRCQVDDGKGQSISFTKELESTKKALPDLLSLTLQVQEHRDK